ncbi:FluC/FEX family fluoride channel [Psychromicrobium xiongbiense]|uniref:FluC/FEX family fluoride channel n=1 Tax=Psychromicrobium xiongbiense TaxID=3051184 RepID=UPI002557505D|nr:CrcB family protein [Psychromicrobium sp. YIM S02556]
MSRSGHWPPWRAWLAVAVCAFVGTEVRYGLGLLFPEGSGGLPWTTLTINVVGAAALAALTGYWSIRAARWWLRAALGPGLLGAFTTFSAVVYAVNQLDSQGSILLAVTYLLVTLVAGLAAAALGLTAGQHWARQRQSRQDSLPATSETAR